jgi:hypothetical protein
MLQYAPNLRYCSTKALYTLSVKLSDFTYDVIPDGKTE